MKYKILFLLVTGFFYAVRSFAQLSSTSPGAGNPIIPGYFADPTVKKFGDTWYIYATTDGNGGGLGPPQVWTSKDFVNWSMRPMNWPLTPYYWAPDVTRAADGRYYMYYCQPVEIYGASSSSPTGPWSPLLPQGKAIVPNFLIPDVITLDGQTFKDDDGKMYMFWGTWGIYPNSGCGIGLLNADMKSFSKLEKLPNTVAKDFFEAPFMFKRKGIYYLTYSSGRCEDETYRVQYVSSRTSPMGPFEYGKNNPVLVTSEDGSVHGPGHQSVIRNGDDFYLVYHRHNNPHSGGGFHRQLCADKIVFDKDGNIEKLIPTHAGIGFLAKNTAPSADLAFGKPVKASSYYSDDFKPAYATDNNNGTLWKAADNMHEAWLEIDLGKQQAVKRVQTQFEYATWYYQYLIEYSKDGRNWMVFADKRQNRQWGSPIEDYGDVTARYVRLKISGTQYPGLNRAVWNIRIFDDKLKQAGELSEAQPAVRTAEPGGLLIDLDAGGFKPGELIKTWQNKGSSGGSFISAGREHPEAQMVKGKKALLFSGREHFRSLFRTPSTLSGNSSFTVSIWGLNPRLDKQEPLVSWADGAGELSRAVFGLGTDRNMGGITHGGWADQSYKQVPGPGKWHHIAVVFDGTMERLFVDGKLDNEENKMLFLKSDSLFYVGTSAALDHFFSGALAGVKVYDRALSREEVVALSAAQHNSSELVYLDVSSLPYGPGRSWPNEGYLGAELTTGKYVAGIEDKEGKIALKLPEGAVLSLNANVTDLLKTKGHTLSVSLFSEKALPVGAVAGSFGRLPAIPCLQLYKQKISGGSWHLLVLTSDEAGKGLVYLDGKLLEKPEANAGQTDNHTPGLSLSKLIIYDKRFGAEDVAGLFKDWQQSFRAVLNTSRSAFSDLPVPVSDDRVRMLADTTQAADRKLWYYFKKYAADGKTEESGWQDGPLFLSYGLLPNASYSYTLKIKDHFGNVSAESKRFSVKTDTSLFNITRDNFDSSHNYLSYGVKGTAWDGFSGRGERDTAKNIRAAAGVLTLESSGSKWDGTDPAGPFLYKQVEGDFIIQAEITDVSGLKEKRPQGANEVGLMVRLARSPNQESKQERLIQNGIMPGWGVGNLVTSLSEKGREQFNNASAWAYDRFLLIRKEGAAFYVQSSGDGKVWKDLPGSPLLRKDLENGQLQVGVFQATYGKQEGGGSFDNVKVTVRK